MEEENKNKKKIFTKEELANITKEELMKYYEVFSITDVAELKSTGTEPMILKISAR